LVDAGSIEARLEHLDEFLERCEEIRAAGRSAYDENVQSRLAAQRAIQLSIQICIDIAAHLIAEWGPRMPADYHGVFGALRRDGLDDDLAEQLASAARMRNVLVHGYLEVDDNVVWDALDHLDDLRRFAAFAQNKIDD